jgi:group I intron endonuclease
VESGDGVMKGVYLIRNNVNQKIYIGSTSESFAVRWRHHRSDLRGKRHFNAYLQRAWNKQGEKNFVFLILEDMPNATAEEILEAEQWYFDNTKTHAHNGGGYNMGLEAGSGGMKGRKTPEETRRKISKAHSGEKHHMYGKHHSEETKRKISKAGKGRKHTEESKRKIRLANTGRNIGEKSGKAKLKECEVLEIRRLYSTGRITQASLAKMFGVKPRTVGNITARKRWKYLP